MERTRGAVGAGLLLVTVLSAAPARASLGEAEASIGGDRDALGASWQGADRRGAFTVHELLRGATRIREYVSPAGLVFAVAWNGPAQPDLGPLLGAYAAEYQEADRQAPRVHGERGRRVAGTHLVVDRWGHMRDLHGRAWIPDLVPPGVTVDEIR